MADDDAHISVKVESGEEEEEEEEEEEIVTPNGGSKKVAKKKKKERKSGHDAWEEVVDVGGLTVYAYLQGHYVVWDGIAVALATITFQIFAFSFFFLEAYTCTLASDKTDCTLTGGLVTVDPDTGETTLADTSATILGIGTGAAIALIFLLPDFMKGIVFFRRGYFGVAAVHILVSTVAIVTTTVYVSTTAVSDVTLLASIVVLAFILDMDEKMYEIHRFARDFVKGKYSE